MSGDRIFLALVAGQQDSEGRITSTRQMWPVEVCALADFGYPLSHDGARLWRAVLCLDGVGLDDTPEVRAALGLPPRLVVTREENEATGVAGVEQ